MKLGLPRKARRAAVALTAAASAFGMAAAVPPVASGADTAPDPAAADELDQLVVVETDTAGGVLTPVSLVTVNADGTASTKPAVPLPTQRQAENHPLTLNNRETNAGHLSRSGDGRYLTLTGWALEPGTGSGDSFSVGRVDAQGGVDTSTTLGTSFREEFPSSAVTADGETIFASGEGEESQTNSGIVRVEFGGDTPVSAVNSLLRSASTSKIIDGGLYVATSWVFPYGLAKVGEGIPAAPAPYTAFFGSDADVSFGSDMGDFALLDLDPDVPGIDTAYMTDYGVQKLSFDGTKWRGQGEARQLGQVNALTARVVDGDVELFVVRGMGAGNQLVRLVDSAPSQAAPAYGDERVLKTAEGTRVLRGVDFAPEGWDPAPPPPPPASEIAVVEINGSGNASSTVAIQRYGTQNNAWRGQLQLPATSAGGAPAVTLPASPAGVGGLRRSDDRRYVTLLGTTAPAGPRTAAPAVVARFDGQAAVDLSTLVTDAFQTAGVQPLEAISADGSGYWLSGGGSGQSLRYVAHGGGQPSAQLDSYPFPSLNVLGGTLYTGGNQYGNGSVNRFETALPTSGAQVRVPLGLSAQEFGEDFALLDLDPAVAGPDTAYLTSTYDPAAALIKLALVDGVWTRQGVIAAPATFAHLTAQQVLGGVELYGSTTDGRQLVKIVDAADGDQAPAATVTTMATANPGTVFRGVAFPPNGAWPAQTGPQPSARPSLQAGSTGVIGTALNPRNPTLGVNLADRDTPAANLTVTVTSSNQNILPNAGITVEGTGAYRRVFFAPIARGGSNLTITVTDPEGNATSATSSYTAQGAVADTSIFFYYGVDDISSALDVGDGYILGVTDEANDPILYRRQRQNDVTGPGTSAVKTFGVIGGSEYDYEGMARAGDLIYLFASHGNDKGGGAEPGRARFDVVRATGTGTNLALERVGGSTSLKPQLIEWDASNGHGLGADALGFVAGSRTGVIPNPPDGFNIEGIEFAPGSSSTLYLAWRAPTVVRDGKPHALIVPVTNIDTFALGEEAQAEFGDPILLDLGGRSIRDIRKNPDDQYLISAGPGNNATSWALYSWDGQPGHQPVLDQILPDENVAGTWETIPSVPGPIEAGAQVELLTDAGDSDGQNRSFGKVFTLTGGPRAGYLKVDVLPRGTGAKVTVDGVVRDSAGLDELALPAGEHEVCVLPVSGYSAPPCETVTIDAETGAHLAPSLVPDIPLYFVWNASTIGNKPVTVTIDGVPVNDGTSGEFLASVTPGQHRICWSAVAGFTPPACFDQVYSGFYGQQVYGSYTANPDAQGYVGPTGMLRVVQTANPLPATVVVDGKPRATWGLDWMRIAPGQHEICWTDVAGFVTPACQTVTVSPGRTTNVEAAFTPAASLRIGANVPAAQLFVDGVALDGWGVWTHLPAGSAEVSFGAVPGYTTPAPRTVTLTSGQLTDVTGEYTPNP